MLLVYVSFLQLLFWFLHLQCIIQQVSSDSNKFRMVDPGEDEKPPRNTRYNFLLRHGSVNTLNTSASSPLLQEKRKKSHMMVFIAITSGPHHQHLRQAIRSTWLLPCIASPHCDYAFFVDCLEDYHRYPHLEDEAFTFSDVVFRNSCALLLSAHPDPRINYGNSPPIPANLVYRYTRRREILDNSTSSNSSVKVVEEVVEEPLPDYHLRRRYKIDWKVCFMQHIRRMYEKVDYYVFVEDDSFVCTDNLLHQMSLLHHLSAAQQMSEFRTGTPMYDGYDDSSTIMSSRVAEVFVKHYLEPGLDCPALFADAARNSTRHLEAVWLSWGNSWISKNCNWSEAITNLYHFPINSPNVQCSIAQLQSMEGEVGAQGTTIVQLPCVTRPLILHHQGASNVLTREHSPFQQAHLCDYMLLIDKVKQADSMHTLWQSMTGFHHFHDFSKVFMHNKNAGWQETLQGLRKEEEQCEQHFPSPNNPALTNDSSLDSGGGHRSVREKKESYPCLFERDTREKESRRLRGRGVVGRRRDRGGERSGETRKSRKISYRDYFSDEWLYDV